MQENAGLWSVWFTPSAMRLVVSRRMVVRMIAARMTSAWMTATSVAGMTPACNRMIRTRRPDSTGRPGHHGRSGSAL